jgi:L-seryl-tRNA(Ser) seleniumtransferase
MAKFTQDNQTRDDSRRAIPSVDDVLTHPSLAERRANHPNFPWTHVIRNVIEDYRGMPEPPAGVQAGDRESVRTWILSELSRRFDELRGGGQIRVINGTGVILHTNLGRAILGSATREAVDEALGHYVSLEVDLESGRRSKRAVTLDRLAALAVGGEAAMVVNNNAAAVYIVVNSYSPPGRVIVSRGELVEIGGSFRLPEILRHAASEVIEVGTTNRTYAKDYRKAARPGDLLLKVHKSNYAIEGFVSEASCAELARVAADASCHLAYDLGSGAVFDYRSAGIGEDVPIAELLEAGVDCVTMSGDKLLGGVQAGIIVGRSDFLEKLRENPLRRAVRVDKVTVAALQQVLRRYLFGTGPVPDLPVLQQVLGDVDSVRERAHAVASAVAGRVAAGITVDVVDDEAAVGGGSWSSQVVPSAAVRLRCAGEKEAVKLARRMRLHRPPVVPRVKGDEIRVNMRTVMPYEDEELQSILAAILADIDGKPRKERPHK